MEVEKISIVLPVYNGGSYLKLSVESVLKQNHIEFELLILDDCSNDGSREYLEGLTDKRIILFKNSKNKGLFYNLNFLIKKSSTNLIKLWAQDDMMYPHCLTTIINFHMAHPYISFSYSGRTIIDENGKEIPNTEIDNTPKIVNFELHARISFYTGSIAGNIANVCINKNTFIEAGGFDESMKISGDFDMWVKLSQFANIGRIKENIIYLRDHKGQLSRKSNYLLFHVKEDIEVYKNLISVCNGSLKDEGLILLRKYKFVFYYTLMLKAFINGEFAIAREYYRTLKPYTNIWRQLSHLLKSKLIKPTKPKFLFFHS